MSLPGMSAGAMGANGQMQGMNEQEQAMVKMVRYATLSSCELPINARW